MIRLQYVDIKMRNEYYTFTQRYFQDWDGSWYFLTCGGVYHVGQVLSEYLHNPSLMRLGYPI